MSSKIKELREKRGVNQEALAYAVGVSQQTISKIENEKYRLPVDILINLSKYFGVSTDYLLGLSDIKWSWEGHRIIDEKVDEYFEIVKMYENLDESNQKTIIILIKRLKESQEEFRKR